MTCLVYFFCFVLFSFVLVIFLLTCIEAQCCHPKGVVPHFFFSFDEGVLPLLRYFILLFLVCLFIDCLLMVC